MPVIQTSIFTVIERFPDYKDSILQFFRENQNFQTICDDYRICAESLKRWNQSTSKEAPSRRKEYADLLQELEAEILQIVDESE
jgi:hypothetical protein